MYKKLLIDLVTELNKKYPGIHYNIRFNEYDWPFGENPYWEYSLTFYKKKFIYRFIF